MEIFHQIWTDDIFEIIVDLTRIMVKIQNFKIVHVIKVLKNLRSKQLTEK